MKKSRRGKNFKIEIVHLNGISCKEVDTSFSQCLMQSWWNFSVWDDLFKISAFTVFFRFLWDIIAEAINMCITWILINSVTKAIISLSCPSTSLFVHLCVRLGVSVCLCFSQSAYMSGYQLSVFAFFLQSPSVHLSVHLPLYLMLFFFWFKTKRFF